MQEDMIYSKKVIWGCGVFFAKYGEEILGEDTILVDANKAGQIINGMQVESLDILATLNDKTTLIIVMATQYIEIFEQCQNYGMFDVVFFADYLFQTKTKQNEFEIGDNNCLLIASPFSAFTQNGSQKFIYEQINLVNEQGMNAVLMVPYIHLMKGKLYRELCIWDGANYCLTTVERLSSYSCRNIIIHSLDIGCELLPQIIGSIRPSGRIICYLHDYGCICVDKFLEREKCQGYIEEKCVGCKYCVECHQRYDIYRQLIENYKMEFIAPSKTVKRIVENVFDNANIYVVEHLKYDVKCAFRKTLNKKIRIAFLGTTTKRKGWEAFLEIASDVRLWKDYEFYVLCKNKVILPPNIKQVEVGLGDNELHMVDAMQKNEIDIAFVGSLWPETYSYTYFEAFEAGAYVFTYGCSGNICDVVNKYGNGQIFRDTDEIKNFMLENSYIFHQGYRVPQIVNVQPNTEFLALMDYIEE